MIWIIEKKSTSFHMDFIFGMEHLRSVYNVCVCDSVFVVGSLELLGGTGPIKY